MTREELIEAMARAHDREEAAQMGEPSPWLAELDDDDGEWRDGRISAMDVALTALESALPGLSDVVEGRAVIVPREPTEAMIIQGLVGMVRVIESSNAKFVKPYKDGDILSDEDAALRYMALGAVTRNGAEMDAAYRAMLSAAPTKE